MSFTLWMKDFRRYILEVDYYHMSQEPVPPVLIMFTANGKIIDALLEAVLVILPNLFPKLKFTLKSGRFETIKESGENSSRDWYDVSPQIKNDSQELFQPW
ncbi:hypothetical protein AVEN_150173-1 [Araneus ventricosus]|uniref:Uncharacterized protein n=1 Tax=Araneus ventricosus TaxID=182803 RepID=A0A4Y2VTJ2_ARAVE|nr:hypothetical protein AVEN_150173-1 [Araneus ventricosus]